MRSNFDIASAGLASMRSIILPFALSFGPTLTWAQVACERPDRLATIARMVVLPDPAATLCEIAFVSTGVVLKGNADPSIVDLANFAARDRNGQWVTYSPRGGEVHLWSPDGRHLHTFGRRGAGPGEFATGSKYIGFDAAGRMYVADNNVRWSVFAADLKFIGHLSGQEIGLAFGGSGFVLDDGSVVSAAARVVRSERALFAVFDPLVMSTGTTPGPVVANRVPVARTFGTSVSAMGPVLTLGSFNTLWAAQPSAVGSGYELQQWNTSGTHVRTIRREVAWLSRPAGASARPPSGPRPELELFHDDGTGVVLVGWIVPNRRWRSLAGISDRVQRRAMQEEMTDVYIEVIDTEASMVLASIGPLTPTIAAATIPTGFLPRSRVGYVREELADGTHCLRIVEMRLAAPLRR